MTALFLLFLTVLAPQQGSVLPNSSAGLEPIGVTKGWQFDKPSNSLSYIVQIAPEAIRDFAEGQAGKELTVSVEPELVGQINSVSVRIGSMQLPQDPPLASLRRNSSFKQPTIQQLHLVRYAPQAQVLPMPSAERTGWAYDQMTKRFAFIVQISPDSLASFIVDGNELNLPIDDRVRNYVEQFTIRIGSGALPRLDPPQGTMRGDELKSIDVLPANGLANLNTNANRGNAGVGNAGGGSVLPQDNTGFAGSLNDNRLQGGAANNSVMPSGLPVSSPTNNFPNNNFPNESPTLAQTPPSTRRDMGGNANMGYPNDSLRNGPPTSQSSSVISRLANGSNSTTNRNQFNDPSGMYRNPGYSDPGYLTTNAPPQYAPTSSVDYARMATNLNGSHLPLGGTTSTGMTQVSQLPTNPISQQTAGSQQTSGSNSTIDTRTFDPRTLEPRRMEGILFCLSFFLFAICIFQFIYMTSTRAKYRRLVLSKRNTMLEASS